MWIERKRPPPPLRIDVLISSLFICHSTTCTQYSKNMRRIFKVISNLAMEMAYATLFLLIKHMNSQHPACALFGVIRQLVKDLHPHALLEEEVVPNSKSFEIYLSVNGSKSRWQQYGQNDDTDRGYSMTMLDILLSFCIAFLDSLIWSGKAHAPPK